MTPAPGNRLVLLDDDDVRFPDPAGALLEPNGLLAVGGDLSIPRLVEAYRHGIFPWYDDDQPILWWSPDPRCVVNPLSFEPGKTLAKRLRRKDYEIRFDHDFNAVINACRFRGPGEGTWITSEMQAAYVDLHHAGIAHSVECYIDNKLAGGLYGLSIGSLFFGESMFHRVTDASKIAFAALMTHLSEFGCPLVDCQVPNDHLFSLGALEIPRREFLEVVRNNIDGPSIDWTGPVG